MKKIKFYQALIPLAIAGTLSLTGCSEEMGSDVSQYDVLSTNEDTDNVLSGVDQVLDVRGEEFKLKINYSSGEKEWRISSDKELNMDICTVGLPSNVSVYIDNIHTDTSIVSTRANFDGIKQDSMDDRIHNSQMIGFPVSDSVHYYGINEIEGENDEFISGFTYGYNGNSSGAIVERRRLESEFLKQGVWANKIDSVIDLIVVDDNKNEVRTVSVSSSLLVEVNNKIKLKDGTVQEYDRNGEYRSISK